MRAKFATMTLLTIGAATSALGWPKINVPRVHLSPPHIPIPHVNIGPIAITPIGPVPKAAIPPAEKVVNTVVNNGIKVVAKVGETQVAPPVAIINVVTGQQDLSAAAKSLVKSQGSPIGAVGKAVSDTNAAAHDLKVVVAQSIAGNVGKTVLNVVDGPTDLQLAFATTTAIEAGEITAGTLQADRLIAVPLAAALRTAFNQFDSEAKPMPPSVRAALAPFYPAKILANARWTISSISIAIPDLIDQGQKTFQGKDYAVTVGNISVFSTDPTNNVHWWAHELQHQVQYANWGFDEFAYRYITSCHSVESDAEAKAQVARPINPPAAIAC